ncbi:MAG: hypothetical protein V4489_08805, partial [Chlamydiota bacterium]
EGVESSSNSVLITIPYLAEKELQDLLYKKASLAVLEKKWIVWELDFFLDKKPIFIQDTSRFFSFGLWIEELLEKFLIPFKENTLAMVLFRGGVDFASYFVWTEQQELLYQEKLAEYPSLEEKDVRSFFAADIFSEYLQRLCSFLPDALPVMCLLDVASLKSPAMASYMLSKERFGHLLLGLKSSPIALGHLVWEAGKAFGGFIGKEASYSVEETEVKIGVCLPSFEKMTVEYLSSLDSMLANLLGRGLGFRVIQEANLHENWDGIDDLIVISSLLSIQGLRKLRGFLAAGGRVVSFGATLELSNEIALSSFLND